MTDLEEKIILDYQVGSVITRVHHISGRRRARGDVTTDVEVRMMCYEDRGRDQKARSAGAFRSYNDEEQMLPWSLQKEPVLTTP